MTEEKNELQTKFSKLQVYLLYKRTEMKGMAIHLERVEGNSRKLAAENKYLLVTKREIIELPIKLPIPKCSEKATNMIADRMEEQ